MVAADSNLDKAAKHHAAFLGLVSEHGFAGIGAGGAAFATRAAPAFPELGGYARPRASGERC